MRIYLDVCCLARRYDDQLQDRVRFETDAVASVLAQCAAGRHVWVASEAILEELSRDPNGDRRFEVLKALESNAEIVQVTDEMRGRAAALIAQSRLRPADALHLSVAEGAHCDVLLTTDDRFMSRAERLKPKSSVALKNPLQWWLENQP